MPRSRSTPVAGVDYFSPQAVTQYARPVLSLTGILSLWLLLTSPVHGSFNYYEGLDRSLVQQVYRLSDRCLGALNQTVLCDSITAVWASRNPERYAWNQSMVTTLCTTECASSLSSWLAAVERYCDGQTLIIQGGYLLAKAIPTEWRQGYELVCQQDSSSNWCYLESQEWQGSDYIRYHPMACYNADKDAMPPECNDPYFSTSFITPDMKNVTHLYDRDLLCSECFIKIWRQQLMSSKLPKDEFTDYLMEQYETIQKFCSVSLPVATYSSSLFSLPTVETSTTSSTTVPSPPATTDTCYGRIIEPTDDEMYCLEMSDLYNVSTGTLEHVTGSYDCLFESAICLPMPCEIEKVYGNPTCEELAMKYSTDEFPISVTQFLAWNPHIRGHCGFLNHVQRVCKGPPGGRFKPSGVIYAPTEAGEYFTTAAPAEPTQPGTTESCGRYYRVVSGDTCNSIALRFGITLVDLQFLNTQIWDNCTNLWLDYDICVAPVSDSTVYHDGTCGPSHSNAVYDGSTFGDFCSIGGLFENALDYCCLGNCVFGACEPNNGATANGTCGPAWGYTTCTNPDFGSCCSIYGYCGDGKDYCGPGECFSGECDPDIGGPSINGECGPRFAGNKTCTGTQFGECCSVSGYCGSTDDYCGAGNCYSGACES